MQTQAEARELAQAMVALGNQCGVNTRALLTDMNTPLGRAAGNWLEVKESVACLDNCGPEDLRELVIEFAAHLLVQTGKTRTVEAGRARAADCLASGVPRQKWNEMLTAQGADLDAFTRKLVLDHTAAMVAEVKSAQAGWVSRCNARIIGKVIRDLGGGRLTKQSVISPEVGVDQIAKPGERVRAGAVLCRVHAGDEARAGAAVELLQAAFVMADEPPRGTPLILECLQ